MTTCHHSVYHSSFRAAKNQRITKGAGGKGPRQKSQKSSKSVKMFSTLFDNFRSGQKTSKIVEKRQKFFDTFSTIFVRNLFSGPFWGALKRRAGAVLGCYQ